MQAATPIFDDRIHPAVESLNFERLKWKLTESSEANMSSTQCELAEREYRRYLTLKKLYPGKELVPNKLVDEFWHAHILDTVAYHADCSSVFGFYLHHFPYFGICGEDDYENLESEFNETKSLYERHFGRYPEELDTASRCADHPCHVPSACACRAPGTCK